MPLSDGGHIRAGILIRSDNLDRLDGAGLAEVQAAGVSRFVDLRSAWECEAFPSPFAIEGPSLKIAILGTGGVGAALGSRWGNAGHVIVYGSRTPQSEKVQTLVAKSGPKASATSPRQAIAGDYATAPPPTTSALPELAAPDAETILRVLAHLDTRYGGTAVRRAISCSPAQRQVN